MLLNLISTICQNKNRPLKIKKLENALRLSGIILNFTELVNYYLLDFSVSSEYRAFPKGFDLTEFKLFYQGVKCYITQIKMDFDIESKYSLSMDIHSVLFNKQANKKDFEIPKRG